MRCCPVFCIHISAPPLRQDILPFVHMHAHSSTSPIPSAEHADEEEEEENSAPATTSSTLREKMAALDAARATIHQVQDAAAARRAEVIINATGGGIGKERTRKGPCRRLDMLPITNTRSCKPKKKRCGYGVSARHAPRTQLAPPSESLGLGVPTILVQAARSSPTPSSS